jgi:hypothetical protein
MLEHIIVKSLREKVHTETMTPIFLEDVQTS